VSESKRSQVRPSSFYCSVFFLSHAFYTHTILFDGDMVVGCVVVALLTMAATDKLPSAHTFLVFL
jgi:hypothetical protein